MNDTTFSLKRGDLFTIHATPEDSGDGRIARGRIFRFREKAGPYIFADYRPAGLSKWMDSPWRLDLSEGIEVIPITHVAIYTGAKPKRKRK